MDSAVSETSPLAAAVDLGGTKIMAAIVGPGHGDGPRQDRHDVRGGAEAIVPQMAATIRRLPTRPGSG